MPPGSSTMGPPLSPRETRRSGRRSAHSVSASASKSPDLDPSPAREHSNSSRTPHASTNHRNKRLKQEDLEEVSEDRKQNSASSVSSGPPNNGNGKGKRKGKEKQERQSNNGELEIVVENPPQDSIDEEEEQGVTRCVCGNPEDDLDAGEFMVQCETCKVWQHGLCMGYQSEEQVHDDDYYCEICRPELHTELLKKLAKRSRQTSRLDNPNSRVSRSHSPTHLKVPASKRRNTMNSRDAAFDESLKEIIEATAAEAAAAEHATGAEATDAEAADKNKKRKRSEDETTTKKRTRSASIASDRQSAVTTTFDPPPLEKQVAQPNKTTGRTKRGGRKANIVDNATNEVEEGSVALSTKKLANNPRAKATTNTKRLSNIQPTSMGNTGPDVQKRNQMTGNGPNSAAEARAYRQTHAYAVSQQTLYTSWNLPDYLSHLEQMLPSNTPQPLEVPGGANSRGESAERTMERGVKVKWPAKRMSVADMNKRVRALVEWVGREQASALDRGRRREALEKALRDQAAAEKVIEDGEEIQMVGEDESSFEQQQQMRASVAQFANLAMSGSTLEMSAKTMKRMEELMEELIRFQEKFGPGSKSRERGRLAAVA